MSDATRAGTVGGTVLVVGGGVGGLLAADKLARDGFEVTLVERNERFGGCNARVELDGRAAPAAFYTALGLEPAGSLARTLQLGTNGDAPPRMTISDHVFTPTEEIALPGDLEGFVALLRARFPAESPALDRLAAEIREVYDAIDTLFSPVTPPQRMKALQTLQRHGSVRYREHLRELVADAELRRLLALRAFASTNTASTVLAYLAKGLIDGFYRLPGAGAGVVDRLLERLAEHGERCRLLAGREVVGLVFEDGTAVGARVADGEELRADHVVWNGDVHQLAGERIDDRDARRRVAEAIDGFVPGLSAITVVFALAPSLDPSQRAALERHRHAARLVLLDVEDPFALLEARENGAVDAGMVKVNVDLDSGDSGPRVYAEIDCAADARFEGLDLAALAGREEETLAPLVDEITGRIDQRILPGFAAATRSVRVLTPHTYRELTGSRSGAGSGWRDDVETPRTLERELARLGLFLVGQWSMYGSGLSQLETSAQAVVREIRRRRPRGER